MAGSRLARQLFPQSIPFEGEDVLRFVELGLYRKHRKDG
jgi:hypothetical protein